eukprot:2379011-Prymnesium_polylepis.1
MPVLVLEAVRRLCKVAQVVRGDAPRLRTVVGTAPARCRERWGDRPNAGAVVARDKFILEPLLSRVVPPQVVLALDAHSTWQRLRFELLPRRVFAQQLRHEIGERRLVQRRHALAPCPRNATRIAVVLLQPAHHLRHVVRRSDCHKVNAREQAVLIKFLVCHAVLDVDDDGAAQQQVLELVGVAD